MLEKNQAAGRNQNQPLRWNGPQQGPPQGYQRRSQGPRPASVSPLSRSLLQRLPTKSQPRRGTRNERTCYGDGEWTKPDGKRGSVGSVGHGTTDELAKWPLSENFGIKNGTNFLVGQWILYRRDDRRHIHKISD